MTDSDVPEDADGTALDGRPVLPLPLDEGSEADLLEQRLELDREVLDHEPTFDSPVSEADALDQAAEVGGLDDGDDRD